MQAGFHTQFKIIASVQPGSDAAVTLSRLYLPVIGAESFALYYLCAGLPLNKPDKLVTLVSALKLSVDEVLQSFARLEAVGLCRTYYNAEKGYAFELLAPLSAREFLAEPVYFTALASKIGVEAAESLKTAAGKPRGYEEVSRPFDAVFKPLDLSLDPLAREERLVALGGFNYSAFLLMAQEAIPLETLTMPKTQNAIQQAAYLYELSEEEMKISLDRQMEKTRNFKLEDIAPYAERFAIQLGKRSASGATGLTETGGKTLGAERERILRFVKENDYATVWKSMTTVDPREADLEIFRKLEQETQLKPEVINILMIYVNKVLNSRMPKYDYYYKVALTFVGQGLKTALDAYVWAEKDFAARKNRARYSKQKAAAAPVPPWYGDFKVEREQRWAEKDRQPIEVLPDLDEQMKELFGDE